MDPSGPFKSLQVPSGPFRSLQVPSGSFRFSVVFTTILDTGSKNQARENKDNKG